jgi:hypothetical protein
MFTWIMLSAIITKISFMKKTKNDRDGKKKGHEKSKGQSQKNEVPGEWKRVACFFEWFDAEGAKVDISLYSIPLISVQSIPLISLQRGPLS